VSDIDTVVVDSLKALDLERPIREADVASNNELKVDDGAPYPLALDGTELKINNTRVLIADISWGKGVIHILSEDVS